MPCPETLSVSVAATVIASERHSASSSRSSRSLHSPPARPAESCKMASGSGSTQRELELGTLDGRWFSAMSCEEFKQCLNGSQGNMSF